LNCWKEGQKYFSALFFASVTNDCCSLGPEGGTMH
jgi:hypothetical protein